MTQENCNPTNPTNPSSGSPNVSSTPRQETIPVIPQTSISSEPKESINDGNIQQGGSNTPQGSGGSVNGGSGGGKNVSSGNKTQNVGQNSKGNTPGTEDRCPQTKPKKSVGRLESGESQYAKSHGKDVEGEKPCDAAPFPAKSIYPFNKVKESESGHLSEVDDTPGGERISNYHRTGTGYEVEPMGSVRWMTVRDHWFSVYRDFNMHVDGYSHIVYDKGLRVVVNNEEIENKEEKSVNLDVYVNGKSNVNLTIYGGNINIRMVDGDVNLLMDNGDVNIRQEKGNYNHFINGNYNLEVMGNMHVVVKGDELHEVGNNRETNIKNNDELHVTNKLRFNCGTNEMHTFGDQRIIIGSNKTTSITGIETRYIGQYKNEHVERQYLIHTNSELHLYSEAKLNLTSTTKIEISSDRLDSCDIYSPNFKQGSKPPAGSKNVLEETQFREIHYVSPSLPTTQTRKRDN